MIHLLETSSTKGTAVAESDGRSVLPIAGLPVFVQFDGSRYTFEIYWQYSCLHSTIEVNCCSRDAIGNCSLHTSKDT